MQNYVCPNVEEMKRVTDEFLNEADNFIKKMKSYENRK